MMLLLLVIMTVPQVIAWAILGSPAWIVMLPSKLGQGILMSWGVLVPCGWLKGKWLGLYQGLMIVLFSIFTIVDIFFLMKFSNEFNMMFIGMILGSNPGEIREFAGSVVRPEVWLTVGGGIVVGVGLYFLLRRVLRNLRPGMTTAYVALAISVVSLVMVVEIFPSRYNVYSMLPVKLWVNRSHIHFSTHLPRHEVNVIPTGSAGTLAVAPDVVVIVGESLNRDKMGLYGYGLDTNPMLSTLVADSLLYCYTAVEAPAEHTIDSFKHFIGTFDGANDDDSWVDSVTFIDVARRAGYMTAWASNQSKRGIFDNVITDIAVTTDHQAWTVEDLMQSLTTTYCDGAVFTPLDSLRQLNAASGLPLMMVVHLMGNHASFYHRYPRDYEHFTPGQYPEYPEPQRKVRAYYDNATRYNDRIVYDIMKRFDSRQAVVVYFSDHGVDLYHTRPDHFDHAIPGNAGSEHYCRQIPFMIYLTPSLRSSRPDMVRTIRSELDKPFNTTRLIDKLSWLMGVKYSNADE